MVIETMIRSLMADYTRSDKLEDVSLDTTRDIIVGRFSADATTKAKQIFDIVNMPNYGNASDISKKPNVSIYGRSILFYPLTQELSTE